MKTKWYRFNAYTWTFLVLMLVIMVTIFIFSHQEGEVSYEVSDQVAGALGIPPTVDGEGEPVKPSDVSLLFHLNMRNLAHVFVYTTLGGVATAFYISLFWCRRGRDYVIAGASAFFTGVAYAASDELHQYFVPGRNGRLPDIALDSLGVAVGILAVASVWYLVVHLRACKQKSTEESNT